jgi:signal transduction histidine kinase
LSFKESILLFVLMFCIDATCTLQNTTNQSYIEQVNIADQLAIKFHYKEAKDQYLSVLKHISTSHKEFTKIKLKLWEINHKMFIFESDSIFLIDIMNAPIKTTGDIIQAHCLKAKGHFLNQEFEMGKNYLDRIQKISEESQNSNYYLTLAIYFAYKSNMTESSKACFKALNDAEKRNDYLMISNIYSKLSRNYLHESLYDESIKYTRKSIQLQKKYNFTNNLGQNYEIAMYYFYLDSTAQDSVMYYAEASLHYATLTYDINTQIYQCLNLATLFAPIDKKKAYEYLNKLNQLKSEYKIPGHILSNIDLYLGVFEMENENYEKAIEIFMNLKERYAKQSRSEEHLCYEYLSKCYLLTGKLDKALEMEQKRSFTKEKYESEASRKELLSSELKYEILQKDQIILSDNLTILQKELDRKKWNILYKNKEAENLLLLESKKLSDEKNKNLNNQYIISNQKNDIILKQKQITILKKNKIIYTIIALSIFVGIIASLVFLHLLWKKSNSLKKLEFLMMSASQNLLKAKKHLEISDENSTIQNTTELHYNFTTFVKDFDVFEKEIQEIIDDTQKYKFRIHHEIKAPIIKIQNLLSKLNTSENISVEEKKTLGLIQNNIKSMKEITEKMLLLSKIQRVALQVSDIDLKEQITDVIENLPLEHQSKLEYSIDSNVKIQADPLLMKILWENMISNSIKYENINRSLQISISASEYPNHYFISYTDNAQGIHVDEMEQLDITRQILMDNKSNKIGLNIIQNIVDKHFGEFKIQETSSAGTTFTISIPRKSA